MCHCKYHILVTIIWRYRVERGVSFLPYPVRSNLSDYTFHFTLNYSYQAEDYFSYLLPWHADFSSVLSYSLHLLPENSLARNTQSPREPHVLMESSMPSSFWWLEEANAEPSVTRTSNRRQFLARFSGFSATRVFFGRSESICSMCASLVPGRSHYFCF